MFVSYFPEDGKSSNTGLAISQDGEKFDWKGDIFPHGDQEWHKGIARITAVLKQKGYYVVFYDCESDIRFSGEEKATIALTKDFRSFTYPNREGPIFTSPYGTGSLRYVSTVQVESKMHFYYEFSRESGAHELRLSEVDLTIGAET